MKKLLFLLLPCTFFAQEKEDYNVVQGSDLLMSRKATTSTVVDGTPYIQKDYVAGHIANNSKSYLLRYNAHTDEMEFKQNSEILIANKVLGQKFVVDKNTTYVTLNYTQENGTAITGYLVELVSNPSNYSLFKKEYVKKVDALEGLNSYQSSKNSYYERQKDLYLILHDGTYYTLPNSIRKMSEPYKALATTFNKQHNLKLNDQSLSQFITWLNTQ